MPGRQVRVAGLAADGAEQDRVVLADLVEHGVGQHLAGGEVALGAEVVAGRLELHAVAGATDSSTLSASAVTSGPIPSPGMTRELQRCRRLVQ